MSEFDPSRREALKILGKATASVVLAQGISLWSMAAYRAVEDRVAEPKGNPPITVSKDELDKAIKTREDSPGTSVDFQKANEVIGNELKAQVKLKEIQERQRSETNNQLLIWGAIFNFVGISVLLKFSGSRLLDPKR